jgi:hypothetical protein
MDFEVKPNQPDQDEKDYVTWLCSVVRAFDPARAAGSWEPTAGGDMVAALNRLAETLQKKSAEIKQHTRTLTIEELNELDGFDRCTAVASPVANTAAAPPSG